MAALIADDPEDVVWLTNAMIRLRDDPQLAADLARAAQAIAERQTWSAATARYLDFSSGSRTATPRRASAIDLRLSKGA